MDQRDTTCCHQRTIQWCTDFHLSFHLWHINRKDLWKILFLPMILSILYTITALIQCNHIKLLEYLRTVCSPFLYLTYGKHSGLTSHITSTNSSLIRISKNLSSGSPFCRRKLAHQIIKVSISDLVEHVGECMLSSGLDIF